MNCIHLSSEIKPFYFIHVIYYTIDILSESIDELFSSVMCGNTPQIIVITQTLKAAFLGSLIYFPKVFCFLLYCHADQPQQHAASHTDHIEQSDDL